MTDDTDRYTQIRPIREYDGRSPAQLFFYRQHADGTVTREAFLHYGENLQSPYLWFVYTPPLRDPECPTILPNLQSHQSSGMKPRRAKK